MAKDMQTGADSRFGPQTVLPVQFHAERATCPEGRLLLAVLEDALGIHKTYARVPSGRHRRLVAETEEWLFSDDTSWPLSFVNVCDSLGIDVAWLRARLRGPSSGTAAHEAPPLTPVAS